MYVHRDTYLQSSLTHMHSVGVALLNVTITANSCICSETKMLGNYASDSTTFFFLCCHTPFDFSFKAYYSPSVSSLDVNMLHLSLFSLLKHNKTYSTHQSVVFDLLAYHTHLVSGVVYICSTGHITMPSPQGEGIYTE